MSLASIEEEDTFVLAITHESCLHCQHFHKEILDRITLPKVILNVMDLPRIFGVERMGKLMSQKLALPFIIKKSNGKMERVLFSTQDEIPSLLNG